MNTPTKKNPIDLAEGRAKLITSKELGELLAPFYTPSTTRVYLRLGRFPFAGVKIGGRLYVSKIKAENYRAKLAALAAEAEANQEPDTMND